MRFCTNKTIKRVARTVTVLAMTAVMAVNVMPAHTDAKTKTVNAARKPHVLNAASNKSLAELKSTPSVKIGKTKVKVDKITSKTKKYKGHEVIYRNNEIGNSNYEYYSFVKFTAPSTGIYYFTFDNIKVNGNKKAMYSINASMRKVTYTKKQKKLGKVSTNKFDLDGEKIYYTEGHTFENSYHTYDSRYLRELLTSNYESVTKNYVNGMWVDYYNKNNPDAVTEQVTAEKKHKMYDLNLALKGQYYIDLPEGSDKDPNPYYDPTTGTYHTHEKLKKGQTVLIVLSNPCEFTWKPYDGNDANIGTDAKRTISKSGYTIDLTIKKK